MFANILWNITILKRQKMKIYVLASKNTLKTVRYFAIALLLFIVLFWGKELIRTRDYKKITAEIIRVETMVDDGIRTNSRVSKIHYIHYQYEVNDKIYQGKYRILLKPIQNQTTTVIYYSEKNPEETRDPFLIKYGIVGITIVFGFLVFLSIAIRQ